MPNKGWRLGDVRVAPGRRKVEILTSFRSDGSPVWVPYWTHLKENLIACCPSCGATETLKEFVKE